MFLNWLLGIEGFWSWPTPQPRVGPEPLEIVKVALTVVAGVGGFVALTVAYRRQVWLEAEVAGEREQQKALHDRYGAGVAQLGHESPTVRLAGVYALTNLADQWETQRQQCVDVLCAYLRIPWAPPEDPHPIARKTIEAANDPQPGDTTTYTYPSAAAENEVRKTIIRVISDHLRPSPDGPTAPGPWSHLTLDFTGAILPESNFIQCAFGNDVQWRDTHFLNDAEFSGATFAEDARFGGATFSGVAGFGGATFLGDAGFDGATFLGVPGSTGRRFWGSPGSAGRRSRGSPGSTRRRFRGSPGSSGRRFWGMPGSSGRRFRGHAGFVGASFSGRAGFGGATFLGDAWFDRATFSGRVNQEIHTFLTEEQLAHIGGTGADEAEGGDPVR